MKTALVNETALLAKAAYAAIVLRFPDVLRAVFDSDVRAFRCRNDLKTAVRKQKRATGNGSPVSSFGL
jgi:hypothetical protein